MAFKLTIERGGCKARELLFDSRDDAVEHAAEWFRDGYRRLIQIDEYLCEAVPSDVLRLRDDLNSGRVFYCSRFGERASIADSLPSPSFLDVLVSRIYIALSVDAKGKRATCAACSDAAWVLASCAMATGDSEALRRG